MNDNPYNMFQNPLLTTLYQNQQLHQLQLEQKKQMEMQIAKKKGFYVCKFFFVFEEETRKIKINKGLSYEGLLLFIQNYIKPFGDKTRINKLQYLDEENEWVNFSSKSEWKDCIEQVEELKIKFVKVKIFTNSKKNKKKEAKKKVAEGDEFYNTGKYQDALNAYLKAISLYKLPLLTGTQGYYRLGGLYEVCKKYKEAIREYTNAINTKVGCKIAYLNRGIMYYRTKQFEKSANDLTCFFSFSKFTTTMKLFGLQLQLVVNGMKELRKLSKGEIECDNKKYSEFIRNNFEKIEMNVRVFSQKPLCVLITGAPASGKGTQCKNIVKLTKIVHISTGQILRREMKNKTELGKRAEYLLKRCLLKDELFPDELVCQMVLKRLRMEDVQKRGFLLDGFPRTKDQARFLLHQNFSPDLVLNLKCPDDVVIERISGRRIDPVTGETYHLKFNPPTEEDVKKRLIQRKEDTVQVIKSRLRGHHKHQKLLKLFRNVVEVNGNQTIEKVTKDITNIMDKCVKQIRSTL